MKHLPPELYLHIFGFFASVKDLVRAGKTCALWHSVSEDDLLWRKWYNEYFSDGVISSVLVREGGSDKRNLWKTRFIKKLRVITNLKKGHPVWFKEINAHHGAIHCLRVDTDRDLLVTASNSGSSKIFQLSKATCIQKIVNIHHGIVYSAQLIHTPSPSQEDDCGTSEESLLYDRAVVSGSRDATVKIITFPSGHPTVKTSIDLPDSVASISVDQPSAPTTIACGTGSRWISLIDIRSEQIARRITHLSAPTFSVEFSSKPSECPNILYGNIGSHIDSFDVRTGRLCAAFTDQPSLTSGIITPRGERLNSLTLDEEWLIGADINELLLLWDIRKPGLPCRRLTAFTHVINSLHLANVERPGPQGRSTNTFLFAAGRNGVEVFEATSGERSAEQGHKRMTSPRRQQPKLLLKKAGLSTDVCYAPHLGWLVTGWHTGKIVICEF